MRIHSAIISTVCLLTFYFSLLTFSPAMAEEENYGTQNFMEAAQADDATLTRENLKNAIVKMSAGIRAGKEDAVNRAVENRAEKIGNPEIRALLFFTLSEAYEENGKLNSALFYLDKAMKSSVKRKSFYHKKKEKLLKRAG